MLPLSLGRHYSLDQETVPCPIHLTFLPEEYTVDKIQLCALFQNKTRDRQSTQ